MSVRIIFLSVVLIFLLHPRSNASQIQKTEKLRDVEMKWTFKYHKNFPGKIELYQVSADKYEYPGETVSYPINTPLPILNKIDGSFKMKAPGGFAPIAMVVKNPTDKDWYFYANFHNFSPSESSTGIGLQCLCVQHIFKVKAKTAWVRLGKIDLNRRFTSDKIEIVHDVIHMTYEELKERNYLGDGFTISNEE